MQALNKQAQRILKLFGHDGRRVRRVDRRPRAGILPDRPPLLLRAARPADRRPHAVRRQAAQGPGVRRPLLRRHSRARAGLHAGSRARAVQARHSRSRPATTRSPRASTKSPRCSRRPTSPHDHQQLIMITLKRRGREVRHGLPAAREAVRRHQRLGQARQLVARQASRRATCSTRATRRTTTPSSWCSARP